MRKTIFKSVVVFFCLLSITAYGQNYSLHFDGVNDKVGIMDNAVLNPTSAITVEAWINADTWKSSIWAGTVVGKQVGSPDRGYCLTVGEGGKAEFTVAIGNAWHKATSPAIMGLLAWYHIAGVYDGAFVRIYINGQLQASTPITGAMNPATGTALNIAENPSWSGRYFDGRIDEVRIWNVARSQSEIADHMNAEITGSETGLVGYWKFNEGSGTSLGDATSNGNNGTLLNMAVPGVWVAGFVPSSVDIGVIGIARPSLLGQGFGSTEKISIEVKNFATETVNSFNLSYSINNGTVVTQTVNESIAPFETYVYTFPTPINLTGQNSVNIKAFCSHASDLNHNNDTVVQTISQSLEVMIFDGVHHNFGSAGQTNARTFYMPDSLNNFSHLKLLVSLRCPAGGCDPWDQFARIGLIKDGQMWELARYITPYGVACGGWEFDISDFRSLLTGRSVFESYIQVWGASGWLVDCKLIAVPGTPQYKNVRIQKLWSEDNWVYGDPTISYDLPDTTILVGNDVEILKVRITNTGHGQGNTNNAAEFMNVNHNLKVAGQNIVHSVWRDDCNANSCSPQNGTWQYPRAGWCPGQDVQPDFFNLAGHFTPGQNLNLDYVLHEYTNLLNTGYNNSSHTEPFLRIHGYLVSYSQQQTTSVDDVSVISNMTVFPNPANSKVQIMANVESNDMALIEIYDALGNLCLSKNVVSTNGFVNETFELNGLKSGFYFVKLSANQSVMVKKLILQ